MHINFHFYTGYYFGVGENMTDTYLVTQTPVECMFMPRVHFHRAGQVHHLERLREKIDNCIPSNKQLFKKYFIGARTNSTLTEYTVYYGSARMHPGQTGKKDSTSDS